MGASFRGRVFSGRGFAVPAISKEGVLAAIRRITGIELIPGTLNVQLPKPFDGSSGGYATEEDLGGSVWRDHVPNRRGVRWGEVLVEGRSRGIIFQGDEPDYPLDQIEIMSDHHLRKSLNLSDGDMVQFTIVNNH